MNSANFYLQHVVPGRPLFLHLNSTTETRVKTFVAGDAGSVWLATPGPRFFRKVTGP